MNKHEAFFESLLKEAGRMGPTVVANPLQRGVKAGLGGIKNRKPQLSSSAPKYSSLIGQKAQKPPTRMAKLKTGLKDAASRAGTGIDVGLKRSKDLTKADTLAKAFKRPRPEVTKVLGGKTPWRGSKTSVL